VNIVNDNKLISYQFSSSSNELMTALKNDQIDRIYFFIYAEHKISHVQFDVCVCE